MPKPFRGGGMEDALISISIELVGVESAFEKAEEEGESLIDRH